MDRVAEFFDTIRLIKLAKKPDDIMQLLSRFAAQFGFNKACAITSIPESHHNFEQYSYAERWPAGWHERYLEHGYLDDDPIIARLRVSKVPFAWHEVSLSKSTDKNALVVMNEATEFDLRFGFNIPIRSANGQLATVMFAGDRYDLAPEDRLVVAMVAFYAHDKMRELMGVRPLHPEQQYPLTPREIEVLKWTAEGKTSKDIARILSVSLPTVQTHITNACKKLDVLNRTHATVRAMRWGIFS
jgi:DNA-binding CsgD family transcriptional regulator